MLLMWTRLEGFASCRGYFSHCTGERKALLTNNLRQYSPFKYCASVQSTEIYSILFYSIIFYHIVFDSIRFESILFVNNNVYFFSAFTCSTIINGWLQGFPRGGSFTMVSTVNQRVSISLETRAFYHNTLRACVYLVFVSVIAMWASVILQLAGKMDLPLMLLFTDTGKVATTNAIVFTFLFLTFVLAGIKSKYADLFLTGQLRVHIEPQ